jgi:hypothetical protein
VSRPARARRTLARRWASAIAPFASTTFCQARSPSRAARFSPLVSPSSRVLIGGLVDVEQLVEGLVYVDQLETCAVSARFARSAAVEGRSTV